MADRLSVTGMVISSSPIGEYDKRIVLLTKERGKISAFARGARRPGNQLMAACESFAFGTFMLFPGRSSYTVSSAEIKYYFRELTTDIASTYYGFYFLELAEYFAVENEDASQMLNLIYAAFRAILNPSIPNVLVRYVYELKLLVINGVYPDFFQCTTCGKSEHITGFSISRQGAVCTECRNLPGDTITITESTLYTLQFIVLAKISGLFSFTVSDEVMSELRMVMDRCMKSYIDKKMKSLEVLNDL